MWLWETSQVHLDRRSQKISGEVSSSWDQEDGKKAVIQRTEVRVAEDTSSKALRQELALHVQGTEERPRAWSTFQNEKGTRDEAGEAGEGHGFKELCTQIRNIRPDQSKSSVLPWCPERSGKTLDSLL